MGKLKTLIIEQNEQAFRRIFEKSKYPTVRNPRDCGLEDSDQAWALYEAEFNDWLDRYEQSFGDEKGYLP